MFAVCNKLKEIKGLNLLNTNKVNNMKAMFGKSIEIEYLDLSNFNTKNVIDMSYMFNQCFKLKEIKGLNKFITNNVNNMYGMFNECTDLEYLDLSNYSTENVIDLSYMFNKCDKLKYLNLLNFSINCGSKNMLNFQQKNKCEFITNNKELLNIYYSNY